MSKMILITGASSGIGKATAIHFQQLAEVCEIRYLPDIYRCPAYGF